MTTAAAMFSNLTAHSFHDAALGSQVGNFEGAGDSMNGLLWVPQVQVPPSILPLLRADSRRLTSLRTELATHFFSLSPLAPIEYEARTVIRT